MGFDLELLISIDIVTHPQTPVMLKNTKSEEKQCNTTKTTLIDISVKSRTIEHVHVGKNCSKKETEAYRALVKEF